MKQGAFTSDPAYYASVAIKEKNFSDDQSRAFAVAIACRAERDKDLDWSKQLTASDQYLGYLHRKVGGVDIYVPFHLAFVFPKEQFLKEAVRISQQVRLQYGHPIGLAGSATFLGSIGQAADIDFCEYYLSDCLGIPVAVCGKSRSNGAEPGKERLRFVTFKCAEEPIGSGDELEVRVRAQIFADQAEGSAQPFKLDYIGHSRHYGYIPVTSWVLPVDPLNAEDGNAARSFPYQEAVIGPSPPVRRLTDPVEFARYLNWLRDKMGKLLEDESDPCAPIKSLKRGLSALLLLGVPVEPSAMQDRSDGVKPPVGQIVDRLNGEVVSAVVSRIRWEEADRLARVTGCEDVIETIRSNLETNTLSAEVIVEALEGARLLAEYVKHVLDEIFEDGGLLSP